MKKTYIAPNEVGVKVEMTRRVMNVTSILLLDDTGSEEYVKEQNAVDGGWDIDW